MSKSNLPAYRSHKNVNAAKIEGTAALVDGGAILIFGEGLGNKIVSEDFIVKHNPTVGGYFVVYEDGYESFSPASAFESGYERVKRGRVSKGRQTSVKVDAPAEHPEVADPDGYLQAEHESSLDDLVLI